MSTPLWRQVYNAWEQAVSPPLQELTSSTGFRDLMALGLRTNAEIAREVERLSRQWLHLWNLPAATDVRKLRKQVAGLERELLALRLELQRREGGIVAGADRHLVAANGNGNDASHTAA
ncbi:MAG: hypothetical protein AAGA93_02085 [Actinomycetota bacterium]